MPTLTGLLGAAAESQWRRQSASQRGGVPQTNGPASMAAWQRHNHEQSHTDKEPEETTTSGTSSRLLGFGRTPAFVPFARRPWHHQLCTVHMSSQPDPPCGLQFQSMHHYTPKMPTPSTPHPTHPHSLQQRSSQSEITHQASNPSHPLYILSTQSPHQVACRAAGRGGGDRCAVPVSRATSTGRAPKLLNKYVVGPLSFASDNHYWQAHHSSQRSKMMTTSQTSPQFSQHSRA
mmetsp:Transcript_592/g.1605  ORF Transcript_592/g.1605 Transcript_592/m.1605 type:complete len:233 (+) Transcript_592:141-839(+)